MNNSAADSLHWSRLLGLCPLAAIGLTLNEALLFSAAMLLTLTLTAAGMALLQHWIVAAQRPIINALLAATIAAILDLLLQAACYRYAQNLTLFLPLLVVVAVLLHKDVEDETALSGRTLGHTFANAVRGGCLFAVTLIIFATLRLFVPIEASIAMSLIGSGLLLAATNKFHPDNAAANPPSIDSPRIRARVTGPVR